MTGYETIVYEKEDRVALVRLNLPGTMNALEGRLFRDLALAVKDLSSDPEVKAAVITGTGPAFSAGGDLARLGQGFTLLEGHGYLKEIYGIIKELTAVDLPVIAAVNGYAVGAGFSLALLCDIIYASEEAKFSMAFVRVGAVPDCGALYFLPRLVGLHRAKELVFTGSTIDAAEACRMGIVNRVFPPEKLLEEAMQAARRLAAGPAVAIKQAKRLLNLSSRQSLEGMLELEMYAQSFCFQTDDHREGVGAFMEKRRPDFKGK